MQLTYHKQYQDPLDPGPIFQHIYHLYTSRPYRIVDRFVVLGRWWTQMALSQWWLGLHLMKGLNLEKETLFNLRTQNQRKRRIDG
jgi:hypothetical protein